MKGGHGPIYSATAHREGDWWVIEVDDVGVTQARHLNEVERVARDLISVMEDVPLGSVSVEIVTGPAPLPE